MRKILLAASIFLVTCAGSFLFFDRSYEPKVYDCFLFFNELEILDIRLHEMAPQVDKFVIVESNETFRGDPKPLYFEENRALFKEFDDKIIHIKLTTHLDTSNPWIRERHQREQVIQGLKGCRARDIILLSDVDEIVRNDSLKEIIQSLSSKKTQVAVCVQKMYYGFLNRFQTTWQGTVAITYQDFKRISTQLTRRLRNLKPRTLKKAKISQYQLIPNAGWHFTSMGGFQRFIKKIESYSHTNFDSPEFKNLQHFQAIINSLTLEPIDTQFPLFVRDNIAHFKEIGFIDTLCE